MTDRFALHLGDCIDVMRGMADASVDAVVTDPPYGIASKTKVQKHGEKSLSDFNLSWDSQLPLDWIEGVSRILKPGGSLIAFTDSKAITLLWNALEIVGLHPLQCIFWRKTNPPPQPRKNFMSGIESGIFARKPGKIIAWNGGGATSNVFSMPLVGESERLNHPTQKPIRLITAIVELISNQDDVVFDPYMGSGTTGDACMKLRRCFVGIELDPEYLEIARARISKAAASERDTLFADQKPTPQAGGLFD